MIQKSILQLLLIFVPFFSYGQVYDFQSLTQEDGLPSSTINAIYQDSRDYVWIGTDGGGLVRYDGFNFEPFNKNNGFKTDFVTDIIEDSNKNLVISSNFNGIYIFDGTNYFKNINTQTNKSKESKFTKFLKTTTGIIAISDFEVILIKPDYSFSLIANFADDNKLSNVNSIVEISKNNYLVGTQNGVFEILNNTTTGFLKETFNSRCVVTRDITNSICIATDKAELYYLAKNKLSKPKIITTETGELFPVKNIFIAKSGNIWMSCDKVDGICLRTRGVNTFFDSSNGFEGNNINCFFQDKSKTLFIGTYGKGIYKTASQQFIGFKNVAHLNNSEIFSVIEHKDKLYTSIKNKEVFEYKISSTKKLSFIRKLPLFGVYASVINNKNQLIFGTSSGLSVLDNDILNHQNLTNNLKINNLNIKNIYQDNSNNYYLSTSGSGLIILDENFKIITQFDDKSEFKLSDHVYSVIEKNNNSWYVSTNQGLFVLKKLNNEYQFKKININDSIFIATKDNFGNYWFAGSKKLYAINTQNKLLSYDQKSGLLLSNNIYTLITNKQGDLLVGSNLGLAKLKINKNAKILQIQNYNSKNGFNGLETNIRAQYKNKNGDVYLATVKGIYQCLARYKPNKLIKPEIKITEIKLFNEKTNWKQENTYNKWYNIPDQNHKFKNIENQLTFKYLSVNNNYTKSASYSFKLDGLEKSEWSVPSNINEITFSNLGFGKYTFRVKLVDNLNNPISNEAIYSFCIGKPFYLNWWFIMTFIAILYVIISIIFTKSSSYNKDFVKNYSENETSREQYRLYLLFLGITIPLIELIVEITGVRARNTLEFNLIVGLFLISIYLLSKKNAFINKYLPKIFTSLFILYATSSLYRVVSYPDNVSSGIEFIVLFFLSFNIFKSIRIYWLFVFTVFGIILTLYTANYISKGYCVVLINYCVLISILNHVKHISNLNSKDKFLFADNIVNKGTALVISVNFKGEVVFCSETITQILGYTPQEVKGFNYWQLTEDSEFTTHDYAVKDSLYVRKLKCKDGTYKFIQWKDSKYSDKIYVGIGQDVTEQIEVQQQYEKLIENANDIIYEIDKKGKFTFINNFTEKLLGFTPEEILGKYFTDFIIPKYVEDVKQFYKNIDYTVSEIPYKEFPIFKKDKSILWLAQKVIIVNNSKGEFIGYSAIARDITQLKNIEIEQKTRQEKIKSYNETINTLVTKRYTPNDTLLDIINGIIKTAANGSKINKIGFWNYSPNEITCISTYISSDNKYESGQICTSNMYPNYFEDLKKNKIIVADDVFNNQNSKNHNFNYFEKNRIKSLLDIPVILNGEIIAILGFETTKEQKNWDNDDISFARSVSDIVSLAIEARKRLETEEKLKIKTEILSGIAIASEKQLKSKNIDSIFNETFEIIGKASKLDRICYFENNSNNKTLSQKNEWVNTDIKPEIDNPNLQDIPHSKADYYLSKLINNEIFKGIVKEIKDEELKLELQKNKILSILNFPIFVKNEFYGFIGFDDYTTEREWTEDEIGVFQIFANNIATSIERIENEKLLEESDERFRLLANNIPGTVYLSKFDEYLSKIYINDEIKNLTGYEKELFLTNETILINLVHEEDQQRIKDETNEAIKQNKPFRLNYRIKHKDGHYIWVEEFGDAILKDGKVVYIEGILIDNTQKREIENEIKAREFAEASSIAKSEFLANMSHEIRTPLNAIIGFSNLIKETKLDKDQNQYITTVNQSANILLEVVNNILDFSKIETGKLELENQNCNIREIINQVIDIVRFDSEQKNIDLNLYIDNKIPTFVTIDALRIKQVLLNLLTNAIKFTNKGKVDFNLNFIEINKNTVKLRFEVQDSGIGIKKDNIFKIFEPFSQEDNSTTRKYGGTGLGLAISNNILALMNSKLELNSTYNKGSLFHFDLTLNYNNSNTDSKTILNNLLNINVDYEEVSNNRNKVILNQNKKVLIVEDNKINMLLARTLVKSIMPNATIYEALNGKLGLEKFREVNPDIVLLDIQMPILNGYETAQEIRQFNTQVPIIALTAGTIKGEKEKCIEVGMNDYISKPILKDAFENMLEKWLQ